MVQNQTKRIVLDKYDILFGILYYLSKAQDNRFGVSRESLARYLRSEQLSSRMTTFGIIDDLVIEGILLDDKKTKYQSMLRINPQYDFDGLLESIFKSHITELILKFGKLGQFAKREKMLFMVKLLAKFLLVWSDERKSSEILQVLLPSPEEDKEVKNLLNESEMLEQWKKKLF